MKDERRSGMYDEAQKIIAALRADCGVQTCGECPAWEWCHGERQGKLDDDSADLIEELADQLDMARVDLEQVRTERDRYWEFIRSMECESCSGDCDLCAVSNDGNTFTGWEWSGEVTTDERVD